MFGLHMIHRAKQDAAATRPAKGGAGMVFLGLCLAVTVALALALPQAHLHDYDGHSEEECPTCTLLLAAGTVAIVLLSRLWERVQPANRGTWPLAGSRAIVRAATPTSVAPRAPPAISA